MNNFEVQSRMNPVMSKSDSLMENILMDSLGTLDCNPTEQQLPMSNVQNLHSDPMLGVSVSQEMSAPHAEMKPLDPMGNNIGAQPIMVPNWQTEQIQSPKTNLALQKSLLLNKRKAPLELTSNDPSTKKVAQVRPLPNSGLPSLSVPNRKNVPMESMSNSPRSLTSSKKKLPTDIAVNRSQLQAPKSRNVQVDPPTKAQSVSSNPVRSKLRESLAAALALVSQQHENLTNEEKNDCCQAGSKELGEPLPPKSTSDTGDASNAEPGNAVDAVAANVSCPVEECRDTKSSSETIDPKNIAGETVETWKFVGHEFQSNPVLHYEDSSFNDGFFGKDELLLGNGLSWAMELDVNVANVKEAESDDKAKLGTLEDTGNDKEEQNHLSVGTELPSPESVASKIEAELFKLFGGVNKKYKEKGRSLLFNLKDKNNPELRERVMSGEITPERLCSMTAEELASKELSEWRIAKAEELAQMKVLPDTEVDLRRLVKKTHKGEFQVVEVERDVAAPVDVGVGASNLTQDESEVNRKKSDPPRSESPIQADETKVKVDSTRRKINTEDQDGQCQLTIPSDGGDMMHGLMVEDMKDLPPIVSLDEFMESLDKEPPFENLHGDTGKTTTGLGKEASEVGGDTNSSDQTSKDTGKMVEHKTDEVRSKSTSSKATVKSTSGKKGSDVYPASALIKGLRIWEGLLQLNISSMANFVGIYKSGEKTGTKEWPRFFEIKGRVRLDAFQRFLQDLPMSRSRAVMVVHFVLAEGCTDHDCRNLQELVDSYIVDQRLGFAEPAPGFEIYFIPPHTATLEMLSKQLSKDYTETLNAIETGLIGFVIWRKAHLPSTTHPKDNVKRQQQHYYTATPISRAPEKDVLNSNVNFASRSAAPLSVMSRSLPDNKNDEDDDDDVPPGFGPPPTKRDDDDLPEFKFSGAGGGGGVAPNPSLLQPNPPAPRRLPSPTPSTSVEQVRQLIQKYGKTEYNSSPRIGSGIALQPWNDDDDDIPEWQPEAPPAQQQLPPPPPPHVGRQTPVLPLHIANLAHLQQPLMPLAKPMQPLQPPMGGGGGSSDGGWWPGVAANMQPGRLGGQNQSGRQHRGAPGLVDGQQGRQWRSDGYRSGGRGF